MTWLELCRPIAHSRRVFLAPRQQLCRTVEVVDVSSFFPQLQTRVWGIVHQQHPRKLPILKMVSGDTWNLVPKDPARYFLDDILWSFKATSASPLFKLLRELPDTVYDYLWYGEEHDIYRGIDEEYKYRLAYGISEGRDSSAGPIWLLTCKQMM